MGNTNSGSSKNGLWTEGFGAIGATLKALEDQGGTFEDLKRIRSDKSTARRVVLASRGSAESCDERLVRRIMKDSFFGRNEWADLGVTLTSRQIKAVGKFPCSEEE